MRYLAYYPEMGDESRPFGQSEWWIMKFCGWFDVHPIRIIDVEKLVKDPKFHGHAWVWLSPHAEHYVGKLTVPRNDVVFVVGHDTHGFYDYVGEGEHVKLISRHPDGVDEEYHAAIAATLLLCELYL